MWVRRDDLGVSRLAEAAVVGSAGGTDPGSAAAPVGSADVSELADGAVRLRIETFSLTANNVTYAIFGTRMRYWDFFPAPDGWGCVPMWGHATVAESRHPDVAPGERVYGYLPPASHLDVVPDRVAPAHFVDAAEHRQPMAAIYNRYARLAADPEHDPAREDARMILGPLFKTGFLIEASLRRHSWHGAAQLIMTSASSKTAMALARCTQVASPAMRRVGITSAAHVDFVTATGLYDDVVTYDAIDGLAPVPSVSVDFAGNAAALRAVHVRLEPVLRASALVGSTHVDARSGGGAPLPGPAPRLFFAPTEAVELAREMGAPALDLAMAEAWRDFVAATERLLRVEHREGLAQAERTYHEVRTGRADPATAVVIRL